VKTQLKQQSLNTKRHPF